MIEAKDLRIGNYCLREGKMHKMIAYDTLMASRGDAYEPIALTPEILEQCGFDDGLYELFANTYLQLDRDNGYSVFIRQDDTNTGGNFNFVLLKRGIKYLHQLQNLYWCLTGEELQLKELTT
jgi:hypothetical protein